MSERWEGIERPYDDEAVDKLRGTVRVEHTLARNGAEKLWNLLHDRPYVAALGREHGQPGRPAGPGRAGGDLPVAAGRSRPTPTSRARCTPTRACTRSTASPRSCAAINGALLRADQIDHADGNDEIDWMVPIVADMEAGFGGHLNVFELTKAMIEAGAAGVHLEDQLASEKKCGHMGGKVLLPTSWAIRNLVAARLAADVSRRPDADHRPHGRRRGRHGDLRRRRARPRVPHRRAHRRGLLPLQRGDRAGDRARHRLRAATPTWSGARPPSPTWSRPSASPASSTRRTRASCWPTTARPRSTGRASSTTTRSPASRRTLGELGYAFQFITLAGFHTLNHSMFELARGYREHGMTAYAELQQAEFANEDAGYTAVKHQHEVGASYFEEVAHGDHRRRVRDHLRRAARPRSHSSGGETRPPDRSPRAGRRRRRRVHGARRPRRPARRGRLRRTLPDPGDPFVALPDGYSYRSTPGSRREGARRRPGDRRGTTRVGAVFAYSSANAEVLTDPFADSYPRRTGWSAQNAAT